MTDCPLKKNCPDYYFMPVDCPNWDNCDSNQARLPIFIALVAEMRSLQKQYFKSDRSMEILRQSKAAELAVDKAIQEFTATSKQQSLF